MRPPQAVTYTDGEGRFCTGLWTGEEVERGEEGIRERPLPELALAVVPPDDRARVRFLVEKATELGVRRLCWLDAHHRSGRPPVAEKALAWASAALEQSRGTWELRIDPSLRRIDQLVGPVWFADPEGEVPPIPPASVTVVIGGEAGFDEGDYPQAALRVRFSGNILRVETAAVAVAAWFEFQHLSARNRHPGW
jgi:16S rRNA U1498 N3-methylase RsmE